jgi:putative ABC transport system permease protein
MQTLLQDLRYASRSLWKSPGFAIVAAATLAIGIGANTAIFSIIETVLLRPLPFRNPEQLLRLYETESAPGTYPFSGPDFIDWKKQNSTFQDMALFNWLQDMNLSVKGRPDHVAALPAEANFFTLLGVTPLLGRTFAPGEDQPGKDQVAILSYGLWNSHFAGDPHVVGQTLSLNSKKYTVIGVAPETFRYPSRAQLWIPLDVDSKTLGTRGSHWAQAIGRMKPGVTIRQAQADLTLVASRLEQQYPDSNYKVGASVISLHEDLAGNSRSSLLMMLSAVGLVLLIACANVANLLLSRAVARQKEMAVRGALGAGRWRLVQQLLTESLLLAAIGGVLGLGLGWAIIALFTSLKSFAVPQFNVIQLNGVAMAFTFAVALVTGALFGVFPALQTARPDLHEELKGGAGSSVSPGRRRRFTSNTLVAGEIALSLLLLVSAGLLLKDFARLRSMDIGVRTDGVWTAALQLPEADYATELKRFSFAQSLLEQARGIPGVETAALSDRMPLEGGSNYYATVRGRPFQRMSGPLVETHSVSPDYFRVMGVRLLQGRVFTPTDTQAAMAMDERMRPFRESGVRPSAEVTNAVVYPSVINQAMARHFWPNENPLGQMFSSGNQNGPWRQVIGVVSDVRQWGITHIPVPEAYEVIKSRSRVFLVLRTSMTPSSLTAAVRAVVAKLNPALPLIAVRTMEQVIDDNTRSQQFLSLLVGSFAGLAALLAAVGIYGVLSYAVTQRTREIGIRISLGASQGRVLAEVLRQGVLLIAVGSAIGIGGAFAVGKILTTLLHEVKPGDPYILVATTALLAMVALIACYIPARRAARLDPTNALRHE